MGNIIGNTKIIKRVQNSKPGDYAVYVNWEAIKELPEVFDVMITAIEFTIAKDFYDIGNNNFMPTPALCYRIAEAKGISGLGDSKIEPIYEEINLSDIEMNSTYNLVKMLVGYRCTKQSKVLEEDGTERLSSPCTIDYNVLNRCAELWAKEEEKTNGYDKSIVKDGTYGPYIISTYKGQKRNVPLKYYNKYKRKKHFQEELKFAQQKAETKAFEKTIRELAGLMTGYKSEELNEGCWYFSKVKRSKKILKSEALARLQSISNGHPVDKTSQDLLFGKEEKPLKTVEPVKTEKSKQIQMLDLLTKYNNDVEISKNINKEIITKIISWLSGNPDIDNEKQKPFWIKAINLLKETESKLQPFMIESHNLY